MASLLADHPDVGPAPPPGQLQRARILQGMVRAAADRGYAQTTVADVTREARASRGTFYALFASKEACFLEAYRLGVEVVVERVRRATEAKPWRAGLEAGLRAYLETLEAEPRFARAMLLEVHAAGPQAQAARDAAIRQFAGRYGASFAAAAHERPELAVPGDDVLFVLSAGVDQLVGAHVRAHDLTDLPSLTPVLLTAALAVLEGTAAR